MAAAYKSKFLKADMREEQLRGDNRFLSTKCDNGAMVEDVFLMPESFMKMTLTKGDLNIIFPIAGGVVLVDGEQNLSPEELYCYCGDEDNEVFIENPFAATINFLHIRIVQKDDPEAVAGIGKMGINEKNSLVQCDGPAGCVRVGVYDSRVKGKVSLNHGCNGAFTFIINGSFEVEVRLMEHRDGLCQWDVSEIEFEALSETAIIMIIEYSQLK